MYNLKEVIVANNTISTNSTGDMFQLKGSSTLHNTNIHAYNNIFHQYGTGNIYSASGDYLGLISDNNIYYSPDSIINGGYTNNNLFTYPLTFAAWQSISGNDQSSVWQKLKLDPSSYKVLAYQQNYVVNGRGKSIAWITNDIENTTRNTAQMDIGAQEFNSPAFDLSITAVSPTGRICVGTEDIFVKVHNPGNTIIDSFTIGWTLNGNLKLPVTVRSQILPGDTSQWILLGDSATIANVTYNIETFILSANGTFDANPYNDTLRGSALAKGLAGNYTVGGTSPNFTTVAAALQALQTNGACQNVTFLIAPGTYNFAQSYTLSDITSTDSTRSVTFTSQAQDSSSVTIADHTLILNNCQYLVFDQLTFESNFRFDKGLNNIVVQRCQIGKPQNYFILFGTNNSPLNGNPYAYHNNTFRNNHFINASITWKGASAFDSNNKFISNTIKNGYVNVASQYDFEFSDNTLFDTIYTSSTGSNHYVNIDLITAPATISGNNVYTKQANGLLVKSNPIYYNASTGPSSRITVSNNSIQAPNGPSPLSIESADMYYNTVRSNSPTAITFLYNGIGEIRNNLFINTAGGLSAKYNLNYGNSIIQSDYNVFFGGNTLISTSGPVFTLSNLNNWYNYSGNDEHSLVHNPDFVDSIGYAINNDWLIDGIGSPLLGYNTDIDANPRDAQHPDPGASEFTATRPPLEAGLVANLTTTHYCPNSLSNIVVSVKNYGLNIIDSVKVQWEVNGQLQTPTTWHGNLATDISANVTLGAYDFPNPIEYTLRFWIDGVNGQTDTDRRNDSAQYKIWLPLNGDYTVWGSSPHFPNLATAMQYAKNYGICGPTRFNLRSGTYTFNQQAGNGEFNAPIPGSSSTNTLTIQSETHNPGDVIFASLSFATQSISNIIFRNLGFVSSSPIIVGHSCPYIVIDSCKFDYNVSFGTTFVFAIKTSGNNYTDTLLISNNEAHGAGFRLDSGNPKYIKVSGNKIFDPINYGLLIANCGDAVVSNNYFYSSGPAFAATDAITIGTFSNSLTIEGNIIKGDFDKGILYNSSAYDPGIKLYNNVVVGGANTKVGISVRTSPQGTGQDTIAYNTVSLNTNIPYYNGTCLDYSISKPCYLANNLFANYSGGKAVYTNLNAPLHLTARNNNYYTAGPNLYQVGSHDSFPTLAALNTVYNNLDINGTELDPVFLFPDDLHFTNSALLGKALPIASIPRDQQDTLRDPTTPNPGAYEVIPSIVYDSLTKDIAITQINNTGIQLGNQSLSVRVKLNRLPNTSYYYQIIGGIDSVFVSYSINDTFIASETFVANLMPGDSIDYTFATTFDIPKGMAYRVKAWVGIAQRFDDISLANDTTRKTLTLPMAGLYTAYGQSPDFIDVLEASNSLYLCGTSNAVTIALRPVVDTSNTVLYLYGSQTNHRVTYRSETGNANDVTLRFSNIANSYIGIEDITIIPFSNTIVSYPYIGIEAKGVLETQIKNCDINGNLNNYYNAAFSFVRCFGTSIENCTFNNLKSGVCYSRISLNGSNNFERSHSVVGCTFNNVNEGIIAEGNWAFADSLIIKNNSFNTNNTSVNVNTDIHDLYLQNNYFNSNGSLAVSVASNLVSTNIYSLYFTSNQVVNGSVKFVGSGINTLEIVNNMFSEGLIINGTNGVNANSGLRMAYNSIWGALNLDNILQIELYNNAIFSLTQGLYIDVDTSVIGGNNSLFVEPSSYTPIIAGGGYYNTVADMVAAHPSLSNVFLWQNASYIAGNDLHLRSNSPNEGAALPITGITIDIDGDLRDPSFPDIGADEYTTPPMFYDVALLPIIVSSTPCTNGNLQIRITNNGTLPILDAEVALQLNSTNIDTITWNGSLMPNDTTTALNLGNINFLGGYTYNVKAYLIDNPNLDAYPYNDSASLQYDFRYNLLQASSYTYCGNKLLGTDTIFTNYLWSNGDITDSVLITSSGIYSLTVSDQYGCIATDSQTVVIIPPLDYEVWTAAADCGVSNGLIDLVILSGTAPFTYDWYPGFSTTANNANIPTGIYSVMVKDLNGCAKDSLILVPNACQDVWPGDANTDGMVNMIDFAYIAIAEGYSGPMRSNANTTWTAQPASNWQYSLAQSNLKHIDTDGNGMVNLDDSLAVLQNYGQSHFKTEGQSRAQLGAPYVYLNIRENSITNGSTVHVDIFAGESSLPLDSLFALGISLSYSGNFIYPTAYLDLSSSRLGTVSELTALKKEYFEEIDFAISRFNGSNVSGFGKVGTLVLKVPDNLGLNAPLTFTWKIAIDDAFAYNNLAEPLAIRWGGDSVIVNAKPVSVNEVTTPEFEIVAYPNPIEDVLSLTFNMDVYGTITVYDLLGNNIYETTIDGLNNTSIDCKLWAQGSYIIELETTEAKHQVRIVKTK